MATIVTHTSPDLDAIGACWLLQRYGGLTNAAVVFVNTGNPDRAILDAADAVVDTGREYDPKRLRFDHHHLPGAQANLTCATQQVYDHLLIMRSDYDDMTYASSGIQHLLPIIDLIYAGDTGKSEANQSRATGIHALLSAKKVRRVSNEELLAYGYELLDLLAERLKVQHEAQQELASKIVYRSDDGLVIAIKDGQMGTTFAAIEQGARLVLFQNSQPSVPTNAIGIQRGGENQEPHVGDLVRAVEIDMEYHSEHIGGATGAIYDELCSWYLHEAGFFAGRGTAKAPDARPITVELADIARLIDRAWSR